MVAQIFLDKSTIKETKTDDIQDQKANADENGVVLEFQEIGVWTMMRQMRNREWSIPGWNILEDSRKLWTFFPVLYHFLQECFNVAPVFMAIYLVSSFWSSTEDAAGLYLSSRLLNIIQNAFTTQHMDGRALLEALISRILFTAASAVMSSMRKRNEFILRSRIRYLFEGRILHANLRLDLTTSEEPDVTERIENYSKGSRNGWWLFRSVMQKAKTFTSIISQLGVLLSILMSQKGGVWFGLICLAKSTFDIIDYTSVWRSTAYIWDSNPHYRRMRSLGNLIRDATHRVEVITDVLCDYLTKEWKIAREKLGDTPTDDVREILQSQRPLPRVFISGFVDDIPLLYYAIQLYFSPHTFSLPSVALMQQASSSITWTVQELFRDDTSALQICTQIKELYDFETISNKIEDGKLSYQDTVPQAKGMAVTFNNVSFSYPRATTAAEVVKKVSFKIEAGQTVVIVGSNGSGKSTLLKLFNRLYDPTSGEIYVDGLPMKSFVAADLRTSMAMLYQTYSHYPLSLKENIALGRPDIAGALWVDSSDYEEKDEKAILVKEVVEASVKEAARLGGSLELIEEQKNGFETVLRPAVYGWATSSSNLCKAFKDKMSELTKKVDVSAGQWQRLALSRLFFRTGSEQVRLVAADEPSASLDPQMEYELFSRLRQLSTCHGKTLIYVTHRFGYLTKHADLILVMHKGELVEQGRHVDLVERNGEYAKLYQLQAEAFAGNENLITI